MMFCTSEKGTEICNPLWRSAAFALSDLQFLEVCSPPSRFPDLGCFSSSCSSLPQGSCAESQMAAIKHGSLSFFSLVFCFLGVFLAVEFLGVLCVCSAYFPVFLRVRMVRKILGIFEVFPWYFQKDQGKEGQGLFSNRIFSNVLVAACKELSGYLRPPRRYLVLTHHTK